MKKIVWLASYPKSGNTMLRIFLSLYLFSKNGLITDFSIVKKIPSFNSIKYYEDLINKKEINDIKHDPKSISKYWIEAQKIFLKKNLQNIVLWKTHNAHIKYHNAILSR